MVSSNFYRGQTLRIAIEITLVVMLLIINSAGAAQLAVDSNYNKEMGIASTIIVYPSLQAAINAASIGDTIEVQSGTYFENVNVTKQLTLRGIGMPVVDARGSGSAITLSADGIILEGFTATGAAYYDAGIKVASNNNTLSDNNASSNNDFGIYLGSSTNNTLSDNNVSNNLYGIYLYYSNNNTLSGNNISNTNFGLSLIASSNNTLRGNNASNNTWGIRLESSSNNNLVNSNILNSNNESGVYLYHSNSNMLSGNNASNNGYGIRLDNSDYNNTLSGNTAKSNNYGISLYYSDNNMLSGNDASDNEYGIYLGGSSNNNKIYNNIFNNTNNLNLIGSGINTWNTTNQSGTTIIGGPYFGGNFWGYPNGTGFSQICTDGNKDGFCDTNYSIASGNVDYLPLTIPAGYGYIYGKVMNNSIGIEGTIVSTNTSIIITTDASGIYSLIVPAGTYNLTARNEPRFYTNSPVTITVLSRTNVVQDIELVKKPVGNITGSVTILV